MMLARMTMGDFNKHAVLNGSSPTTALIARRIEIQALRPPASSPATRERKTEFEPPPVKTRLNDIAVAPPTLH